MERYIVENDGGMETFSSQISTIYPRGIWWKHIVEFEKYTIFILSVIIICNTNNVKHQMTGVEDDYFPYI